MRCTASQHFWFVRFFNRHFSLLRLLVSKGDIVLLLIVRRESLPLLLFREGTEWVGRSFITRTFPRTTNRCVYQELVENVHFAEIGIARR